MSGCETIVATGLGHVVDEAADPSPFLRSRKTRKFMARQDDLAVVAVGRALASAGLEAVDLGERTGLFATVGFLPFEAQDVDGILSRSLDGGGFSMARFSTEGYASANPLLTFRCLSNMPAFHVSVNFDVRGPYLVSYPGPGQFYAALEEALAALGERRVDVSIALAVAHQRNFLVAHHLGRLDPPVPADALRDAAGAIVLERGERAMARRAKARARLASMAIGYRPRDPFEEETPPRESFGIPPPAGGDLGCASLPVALSMRGPGTLRHSLESRDGFDASSEWEVLA
jgi:3-oxoacyl-(acyl-carrier-protein) synthase